MFLGIGAISAIANIIPNENSKSFKTFHEPLDATTKQKESKNFPIIQLDELEQALSPIRLIYGWKKDFNEFEYYGEIYMPL